MPESHIKVRVERDHLQKLATSKPIPAVSELIWNSLDADATRVDLEIESGDLGMRAVSVRDNGHGVPFSEVESLFGTLGGSWKALNNQSKTKRRMLHGKEGKGRFKALALGRVADWTIRYLDEQKLYQYKITMIRDDLVDVRVTSPVEANSSLGTGVDVRITELDRDYHSLHQHEAVQSLSEIFSIYLTDYKDAKIFVENEAIDPTSRMSERTTHDLGSVEYEGSTHTAELEIIEWKAASERWFFLCGSQGFPFAQIIPKFHTPGFQFTAYLKSTLIDELQKSGTLDFIDMIKPLQHLHDSAVEKTKSHFQSKESKKFLSDIQKWKEEDIYPYRNEPSSSIERAERQIFDIVALNVNNQLRDFDLQNTKTRAFQLRMLRQAIERGPDELQHILSEVLDLPEAKQKELSKLLEEADLANVISASKLVADRLKFVRGLETLLFDPGRKNLLKERSQLHRMIAENNTWIFGEEFNLTVDDQSLTEVLRKHRKLIGDKTAIDQPVKRIDGKVGIVDLMMSRSVPQSHPNEREHLVVELKRPSTKIGAKEIEQVLNYALAVAKDERFRTLDTKWSFWVISTDFLPYADAQTRQMGRPKGQVYISPDGQVQVWVKAWAEIIAECNSRMKFIQDRLQANVDKDSSLNYLRKTYEKYLVHVTSAPTEKKSFAESSEGLAG